MTLKQKKNLIISPTGGDFSAHKEWIQGSRGFDLMLVNYGDHMDRYREDADYYLNIQGLKLNILKQAIEAKADKVSRYEAIWLPDDDLSVSTLDINRLFELFHQYQLDAAQPAVKNNFYNHAITAVRPLSLMRRVNFVEMMCPMFRSEVLFELLPLFDLTVSGFGIDGIWSKQLSGRRVAIIDEIGVIHTKRPRHRGPYYDRLKARNVDASQEGRDLLEAQGVDPKAKRASEVMYRPEARLWKDLYLLPVVEKLVRLWQRLGFALKGL